MIAEKKEKETLWTKCYLCGGAVDLYSFKGVQEALTSKVVSYALPEYTICPHCKQKCYW